MFTAVNSLFLCILLNFVFYKERFGLERLGTKISTPNTFVFFCKAKIAHLATLMEFSTGS